MHEHSNTRQEMTVIYANIQKEMTNTEVTDWASQLPSKQTSGANHTECSTVPCAIYRNYISVANSQLPNHIGLPFTGQDQLVYTAHESS